MKWLIVSLVLLISNTSPAQYFHIKNTSIENLQTNVGTTQELKIIFSSPLDLTFDATLNDRGDHDALPVSFLRTFLENSNSDVGYITSFRTGLTNDTLYLTMNLEQEKIYGFRIIDGRSVSGDKLTPYGILFSTGATIPQNTISGKISAVHPGTKKMVFAVRSDARMPDAIDLGGFYAYRYASISDDGSYQIQNMGDGLFFIFAIEEVADLINDAPLRYHIGLYDPNNDAFPDFLDVFNLNSPTDINLTIKPFVKSSTAASRQNAENLAKLVFPNSYLIGVVDSEKSDTTGLSGLWTYIYYDPSTETPYAFNYSGTEAILNFEASGIFEDNFLPFQLDPQWKNSDEIIPKAFEFYKGEPAYQQYPNVVVRSTMLSIYSFMYDKKIQKNEMIKEKLLGWSDVADKVNQLKTEEIYHPYWYIQFRAPFEYGYENVESVIYDGISGIRMDFSPQNAKSMYQAFREYKTGNEVLMLGSEVDENGYSDQWGAIIYNIVEEKMVLYVSEGNYVMPFILDSIYNYVDADMIPDYVVDEPWLDSDSIIHIMNNIYFQNHMPAYVQRNLVLAHANRVFPADTTLYWSGEFRDYYMGSVQPDIKQNIVNSFIERYGNLTNRNSAKVKRFYKNNEYDESVGFRLNARTGKSVKEPMSTALSQIPKVTNIAKSNWSQNAQLYGIGSLYPVNNDGKSVAWYYDFMNGTSNNAYRVYSTEGFSKEELISVPENFPVENTAFENLTINSDSLPKIGIDSPYDIGDPYASLSMMKVDGKFEPVWQIASTFDRDEYRRQDGDTAVMDLWALEDGSMYFYLNALTGEFYDAHVLGHTEREGLRSAFHEITNPEEYRFKGMFTMSIDSTGTSRLWYYIFYNTLTDQIQFKGVAGTLNFNPGEIEISEGDLTMIKNMEDMKPWTVRSDAAAAVSVQRIMEHPFDFEIKNVSVSLVTGVYDPNYQDAAFMSPGIPYWVITFMSDNNEGGDYDTSFTINALTSNFVSVQENDGVIQSIQLNQNYPNPFNPETVISYKLNVQSDVRLVVYDLLGREVETLVNGQKPAGDYKISFDGSYLPSGIYFYQLKSGGYFETKKMVILK